VNELEEIQGNPDFDQEDIDEDQFEEEKEQFD
jgi:hypothetical protein